MFTGFCDHVEGECHRDIPHYVEGAISNGPSHPGLEDCIVSLCCYCEQGNKEDEVACTTKHDLGSLIGEISFNSLCKLAPIIAPSYDYTGNCEKYLPQGRTTSTQPATAATDEPASTDGTFPPCLVMVVI